jgi:hypothetical protein
VRFSLLTFFFREANTLEPSDSTTKEQLTYCERLLSQELEKANGMIFDEAQRNPLSHPFFFSSN